MNVINEIGKTYLRPTPEFRVGDTVRVHYRIREGEKTRVQVFQGLVIRRHGRKGADATFTVRKVSYGTGVERIFPLNSPLIEKIEMMTRSHVRRARLYYLRDRRGKAARLRELGLRGVNTDVVVPEEGAVPTAEEVAAAAAEAAAAPEGEAKTE